MVEPAADARHGDRAGAVSKRTAAIARSPNWADPHEALGNVLVADARDSAALSEFWKALQLAPAWTEPQDRIDSLTASLRTHRG